MTFSTSIHSYLKVDSAINSIDKFAYAFYISSTQTLGRLTNLSKRILTVSFILEKTKNVIKGKVFVLSDPPYWNEKMHNSRKKEKRLGFLKRMVKKQMNELRIRDQLPHSTLVSNSDKCRGKMQAEHQFLKERYQHITIVFDENQKFIQYLERQRQIQIGSRFDGYLGIVANLIVPGWGVFTSVAVKGAAIVAQEKLVNNLSKDSPRREEEARNVRINTLLTIACTVTSVVLSLWVIPLFRQATSI